MLIETEQDDRALLQAEDEAIMAADRQPAVQVEDVGEIIRRTLAGDDNGDTAPLHQGREGRGDRRG